MELEPLTDYSLYKAECEKILFEYSSNEFTTVVLRPATVCGYARRQRLDVVVNVLTNLAYHLKKITVFGGNQLRPNIHIQDMVDSYITILETSKSLVSNQIFNVGYENQKVIEIAESVKEVIGKNIEIIKKSTNDNRSYHISSDKIYNILGFKAKKSIKDAIVDLKICF